MRSAHLTSNRLFDGLISFQGLIDLRSIDYSCSENCLKGCFTKTFFSGRNGMSCQVENWLWFYQCLEAARFCLRGHDLEFFYRHLNLCCLFVSIHQPSLLF